MLAEFFISCLAPTALYEAASASHARGQKRSAQEAALFDVVFSGAAFGLAPLIALQLAAPPGAGAPLIWAAAAAPFAFAGVCSMLIITRYRPTMMSLTASSLVYALLAIAGFAAALAMQVDGARGMLTIATMTAAPFSLLLHWLVFSGAGPLRLARPLAAGVAVGAVMTLAASRLGPQDAGPLFAPSRLFWLGVSGALTIAALRPARREQSGAPATGGAVTLDDLPEDLLAYVVGADNCVQAATPSARRFFRLEPSLPQGRAAPVLTPLPAGDAGALHQEGKARICCFTDRAGVVHYVRIHERSIGGGKTGGLSLVIAEPVGELIEQQRRWNFLNGRMASVIDANDDMLVFMSENGLVTEINRCALHFLKKARKDCVGNYVWNLFPQTRASLSAAAWRNLLAGALRNGTVRAEAVLAGAEGQERLFKFNLSKARGHKGAAPELICFGRDITDVTEAQKSFQDAQARLEQTIASRTKELRDAKRAADEANLSKSRFLANMSHELRTPLNAILGYTDLMRQDLADEDKKETQEYKDLDRVTVNARNLLNLINDILDLSKVEANKMTLSYSAVSVSELLDEIATSIEPLVLKRGNLFVVDAAEDVTLITVDRQKVAQCLLNLLSNASKFTEGGRISLKLWEETAEGASMIYFEVRDTGKGMTPQQCETIFDEFVQIEDPDKLSAGGTGLGLPITKRFCRLMGGDVVAASAPGAGSRFTMWVRNRPVEPARAQTEEDAA